MIKKQEFSIAQEKWHKTDIVKGFIAQTGGWDSKNKNIACIISFWKSKIHLENFMKNIHDNIFDENKQVDTYNSITVQYFSSLFNTKTNIQLFKKNIQNSQLLKISNYNFKNSKEKHYERVQDDNWFLEMKKTKNMLKGLLLKSSSKTFNYLVTTFWNNSGNHFVCKIHFKNTETDYPNPCSTPRPLYLYLYHYSVARLFLVDGKHRIILGTWCNDVFKQKY